MLRVLAALAAGSLVVLASGCTLLGPPASSGVEAATEDSVAWDHAIDFVGSSQRVCGSLAAIGHDDDDVFLNIGYDYPDPARFTIVVWDVGSVDPIAEGSTVCATGVVSSYDGVAEIELRSVDAIEME